MKVNEVRHHSFPNLLKNRLSVEMNYYEQDYLLIKLHTRAAEKIFSAALITLLKSSD